MPNWLHSVETRQDDQIGNAGTQPTVVHTGDQPVLH